jgi:endonuclease-3
MDKKTASKILAILIKTYPKATTALIHSDPWQLLVATILSAQCTDERVNKVTPGLFRKYRSVNAVANASLSEFEQVIRSTGFYRNKAKNIIGAAKMVVRSFGGKVPSTIEELIALPGVARKTANIVLFHAYGKIEGIAVDTHVIRVSGRLGLTKNISPEKIEDDLMALFDRKYWGDLTNLIILLGRGPCDARKPDCPVCPLVKNCPSAVKLHPELRKI